MSVAAFEELGVMPELIAAAADLGWSLPTDIQAEAVPLILGGGDVLAAAETGSGKTGAFALPVLQLAAEARRAPPAAPATALPASSSPPRAHALAARMSATDRDGLLSVSPDGLAIQARAEGAWAGGRGSLGVASGSGARAWWSATAADNGLARLGVALPGASFDLGTDARGWGYGGTGRKAHGGSFAEYGGPWGRGDTVGVALDLAAAPPCLAFYKNGAPLGPAYELPAASPAFFPAAYLKNAELHLKFGGAADEPPPGFAWLDALPAAAKATAAAAGTGGEAKKDAAPPPSTPPVALVLEPTRDLAEQAADTFVSLGARLPGVRTLCVTGGTAVGPQKAALAAGEVEVVVGTLGRVQELVDSRALSLASIRVIVLDEADRLLDSSAGGSGHGVAALVGSVPKGGAGSTRLQVCLFSATLQAACVTAAAAALCANPIHIDLKGGEGGPGGGPAPGTALPEGVDHVLVSVDPRADRSWLQGQPAVPTDGVHAADRGPDDTPLLSPDADSPEAWSEATKRLKPRLVARLADSLDMPQALIFVRTNHDAACLQAFLDGLAPGAPPSAGRRPDAARETGAEHPYSSAVLGGALAMEDRRAALAAFKAGTVRFLIATDVAARGIDVAALPYVINLTLPPVDRAEDYVHRIGRVGRAGARGLAISLVASLPEKVWFVTRKGYRPWAACPVKAADTATTEEGGHTVWYDERAALKAVEARLGGEVLELGPDLSLPPALAARAAGGAGGGGYGGKGGEAAAAAVAEQKARLAALRPAVERLAALETEAQVAFFALQGKLAAMAFAALSAWLGGAVDAWLVHAHAALARNVGQSAKVWAMGAEKSSSSASTTLPGTPTAIILGYSLAPDGSAGPGLAARARAGADLYASGAAPALTFSGGHPGGGLRGGRSEAGVAAGVAAAHLRLPSVPPAWRLEEASTSTWENALLSLRMMEGGGGAIIVVTSPFHLGRAARTFARAAAVVLEGDAKSGRARPFTIFAHAPPVDRPTSPAQRATATYEAVREVAALAWYWVRGRLA